MSKYYHCTVKSFKLFFDKKGNSKRKLTKDQYLVSAQDITQAEKILKQNIDGIYTSPEYQQVQVISVRQSKIINIYEKIQDMFSE